MTDVQRKELSSPSWKWRRVVIFSNLIYDAIILAVILAGWLGGNTPNSAIGTIAALTICKDAAIIGSYVFGAAWTDISAMKHLGSIGDTIGQVTQSTRRI